MSRSSQKLTETDVIPVPSPAATPAPALSQELQRVQALLDSDRAEEALRLTVSKSSGGPAHQNARAVCLMRLGRFDEAVRVLRSICLGNSVFLREGNPLAYNLNFATALALSGNVSGAAGILIEISKPDHPGVQSLRAAIRTWEQQLSWWQWLQWKGGIELNTPLTLESPPGALSVE